MTAGKYKGWEPISINEDKFRKDHAYWCVGDITATTAMFEIVLKPNAFTVA